MKPAPFDYHKAADLTHTLDLLDRYQDDVRILAGGQSLVPLLAMRLARPEVLIDINVVAELSGISVRPDDNEIIIKAGTRQSAIQAHSDLSACAPLLDKALRFVGHQQTRNRGTIGGKSGSR